MCQIVSRKHMKESELSERTTVSKKDKDESQSKSVYLNYFFNCCLSYFYIPFFSNTLYFVPPFPTTPYIFIFFIQPTLEE